MPLSATNKSAADTPEYLSARKYASLGYLVGFMPHGTKHGGPGTEGLDSFSDDLDRLLEWRESMKGAKCNIALVPPEGCMVMDVDLYKVSGLDKELAEARVKKFIEETKCSASKTASGGVHLLVQDPGEGRADNDTVHALFGCPGEIRRRLGAHRGYVIGPGSVFEGKPYTEIEGHEFDGRPAPALPTDVLKRTAVEAARPQQQDRVVIPKSELRNALSLIPADDYHVWLRVGFGLHFDYGDEGFEFWGWWSLKSEKYPGEEALRQKWASFGKNPSVTPVTSETITYMARQYGYGRKSAQEDFLPLGDSADDWRPFFDLGSVTRFLEEPAPPVESVLNGFLQRGKVGQLAGQGGSSKSTATIKFGIKVATGRPTGWDPTDEHLFDPELEPRRVLIYNAEDDRDDFHRRMEANASALSKAERKLVGENLAIYPTRGYDTRLLNNHGEPSDFAERLRERASKVPNLRLVVFDPAILFSGINENDGAEVAALHRVLDRLARELNVGVLVVAHVNKAALRSEEIDQGALSGHSANANLARSVAFMRPMTPEDARRRPGLTEDERRRLVLLSLVKTNYGVPGRELILRRGEQGRLEVPPVPVPDRVSKREADAAHENNAKGRRMLDFLRCVEEKPNANAGERRAWLGWKDVKTEQDYRRDALEAGYIKPHGDATGKSALVQLTRVGKTFLVGGAK